MQRLAYQSIAPDGVKALGLVYGYVMRCGLPPAIVNLAYLRASQINGCAYCIAAHSHDLLRAGVSPEKLLLVSAWREATHQFDDRERAALLWTETVTKVADTHIPDADFQAARACFSDKELTDLTIAIGLINAYNRLAVGFRKEPSLAQQEVGSASRVESQTAFRPAPATDFAIGLEARRS